MSQVVVRQASPEPELRLRETHFAFGKNWDSFARLVSEARIDQAVSDLIRLTGGELSGKTFLDIGCGSGLQSLAALRLGAARVLAVDIDPDSVAATRRVLAAHAPGTAWEARERSVFELDATVGTFDVVHSWGVLHHTGDMHAAIRQAVQRVAPGGRFLFALYRRTRLCGFWRAEKRWYAHAGPRAQSLARRAYIGLMRLKKGRRAFEEYVRTYALHRGMDFEHDVHDWLGGWPYESISPQEVENLMRSLGLRRLRALDMARTPTGLFGAGCDEYAYARD